MPEPKTILPMPYNVDTEEDICPLESIEIGDLPKLHKKLREGGKASEEEEDYLLDCLLASSHSSVAISLMRWVFNFNPILTVYVAKTRTGDISEVVAPSKESIARRLNKRDGGYSYIIKAPEMEE